MSTKNGLTEKELTEFVDAKVKEAISVLNKSVEKIVKEALEFHHTRCKALDTKACDKRFTLLFFNLFADQYQKEVTENDVFFHM